MSARSRSALPSWVAPPLFAALVAATPGCASAISLCSAATPEREFFESPYAGPMLSSLRLYHCGAAPSPEQPGDWDWPLSVAGTLDLPFSLGLDLALLPVTAPWEVVRYCLRRS